MQPEMVRKNHMDVWGSGFYPVGLEAGGSDAP